MKEIYLAGGCFWGVQRYFDQFEGVLSTDTGYANGPGETTYKQVCQNSGHAETVKIVYDENKISLEELIAHYFAVIDPVSVNRQGHDSGIQYRTGIYYTDPTDEELLKRLYAAQQQKYDSPLAVELQMLENFCRAEEYHQKYLEKNPGGYCHIPSEMFALKK